MPKEVKNVTERAIAALTGKRDAMKKQQEYKKLLKEIEELELEQLQEKLQENQYNKNMFNEPQEAPAQMGNQMPQMGNMPQQMNPYQMQMGPMPQNIDNR